MKIAAGIKSGHGGNLLAATPKNFFPEVGNRLKRLQHKGVSRSLRYMARHYTRPIQISELVDVSGMSPRGLVKAFNRHLGQSPGVVIRQARIEFAKQLLMEQDLPLKTIATTVGFRSQNTFCIAFSRATGMAPKRYQRRIWLSVFNTVTKLKK